MPCRHMLQVGVGSKTFFIEAGLYLMAWSGGHTICGQDRKSGKKWSADCIVTNTILVVHLYWQDSENHCKENLGKKNDARIE